MTIEELEETFRQLHERLLRNELEEESFRAQVDQLCFQDDQGNRWKIGWYTGRWYRYDQGQWIQDVPRQRQVTPVGEGEPLPAKPPKAHRPPGSWLAPVLIGLLALAAIALALGWYANRGNDPVEAEASPVALTLTDARTTLPTATGPDSPTSTAQATSQPSSTTPGVQTTPLDAMPNVPATLTPSATAATEPMPTNSQEPPPMTAPAAASPLAGKIFFPVYDPARHTFDIYGFDLASGEKSLVVEQASQPALSPNGHRLAYRSWDSQSLGLRVQELTDGNTWTWIRFAEAARPSWSPDSENIVFPSKQEPDREWRIYRSLGLEFDRVRRHGGDILGRVPTWLSDGRIVYWECPLNQCGLYAMQSDGTSPVRLTTYEYDTTPAGSPDGNQIAFMSDRDGNWEIYTADTHPAATQQAQRLSQDPAREGLPTWSPDGRWLAFVTDREGTWAVWAMQPDGSGERKLFDLGGSLEGEISGVTADNQNGWTWESIAWGPRTGKE